MSCETWFVAIRCPPKFLPFSSRDAFCQRERVMHSLRLNKVRFGCLMSLEGDRTEKRWWRECVYAKVGRGRCEASARRHSDLRLFYQRAGALMHPRFFRGV